MGGGGVEYRPKYSSVVVILLLTIHNHCVASCTAGK